MIFILMAVGTVYKFHFGISFFYALRIPARGVQVIDIRYF